MMRSGNLGFFSYSFSMLRAKTIVPVLLLLLLHDSLADRVCLKMTDHRIDVSVPDGMVVDGPSNGVTCTKFGKPCYFQCTTYKIMDFRESRACFEASVTTYPKQTVYLIHNYSKCTKTMCVADGIQAELSSLDCKNCNLTELQLLYNMQDACSELFWDDLGIKFEFNKVEKHLLHNIIGTFSFDAGGSKIFDLSVSTMKVFNISDASLDLLGEDTGIQLEAPQVPMPHEVKVLTETITSISAVWLPVKALRNLATDKIVGLIAYKNHNHFQFGQERIMSKVLRIEILGNQRLQDLDPRIAMNFTFTMHTKIENDSQLLCHYFDEEGKDWKTVGCETINSTGLNHITITCLCNHATAFAILLVRVPIAEMHWKILSHISYIGCGLSAFFTALSLVFYGLSRGHKWDYSISIHMSLSTALFLLNTTFLLTEWGAAAQQEWLCMFVAAFMHYSLLCSFTWMAIEALHLYLLLIKVYNAHYKHYLLKLSFGGWGVPGIIVAVSVGVKDFKQFYGLTEISMAHTNQTSSICWITDDTFFYSLNLLYFTLIFIFNSGILVAVASNICRMKRALGRKSQPGADGERFSASCRSSFTVLGLTCLMGTTWGLAFLGSGYVSYPILYLFCIFNSTQGFFVFLWICLSARNQRRRIMEDKRTSTPMRTSGGTSEEASTG